MLNDQMQNPGSGIAGELAVVVVLFLLYAGYEIVRWALS